MQQSKDIMFIKTNKNKQTKEPLHYPEMMTLTSVMHFLRRSMVSVCVMSEKKRIDGLVLPLFSNTNINVWVLFETKQPPLKNCQREIYVINV